MTYAIDARGCAGNGAGTGESRTALLPVNPFYAPRYHFGMLLGVDDFESEQAYHRGKTRLHNAWLHRAGTVWGLRVDAPEAAGAEGGLTGELRVLPGLALDAAGRELFLAATACVSLPAWYAAHRDDPELQAVVTTGEDGSITFDAHVIARFRACLSRPVPAISEPCVDAGGDTAYSRAQETVELLLLPGLSGPRDEPYHRLRLLFGIAEALLDDEGDVVTADLEVLQARQAILALPSEGQPAAYLEAFRRFAALDEMELLPATLESGEPTLFPASDDTFVVLADARGITLAPVEDGYELADVEVDNTVRPAHVATATIQELLCGPLFSLAAGSPVEGGGEEAGPPPGPDELQGPRVLPDSVELEGEAITFTADQALSKASVAREAILISAYDNRDGWREVEIARDPVLDRNRKRVRVELSAGFGGNLVRIIVRGTGPAPILGSNLVPLAGPVGGPPAGTDDGRDFVLMLKRSET